MASRIQGITVEIGGDTTKLSKALESVNKSIKGTQSGLKDVNKLLKLDPSNTELVVQKQKMLKDAIEATKEKLATLKTAAQQANEQLANGEITQQQYDALQREIVETEQNLRSLQDQAATTNATLAKIDEAGEKLQNIGSSVENVGKKFLPVTAAVTGLGTAAVKTAADFDSEMSKVSAISGATGDDFDQLRAKAREMGAKTKFSASEAASAMEYMAMAGWKTSDMLNGIEGVMNLAAASGEDLATTSDIVTDALTAFGLSAADSGHFADILAAASSNANTNVSMMGETFKYCAPIAGALGFSAEDTAEAIGLMANSGIKASQAGTSLRTIMNNLSGEVTFAGKNIGEVTIATSNADGSMRSLNDILADCRVAFSGLTESEKASNAEALVGKNAMSGFLALMNSSETDINKLRGAIENCDGASESMAETMQDNLNGQLTILKSQLEELAISFGDGLTQMNENTNAMPPEEQAENDRDARAEELESTFSYDGYQVVRKELFAHLRDPAIVIRKDSITFNTACITGLEDVVYVHVMFNSDLKRIVVRGCDENDKDALRWCIAKPDKRKSRKMTCKPFSELVYKEMGWDTECRYKMLGYRISFEGETLYVFDLLVPEIFHEGQKRKNETDQKNAQETKPANTRKGFYPDDIAGTFGVPVEEHLKESEVKQMDGYVSVGMLTGKTVPDTGLD